MFARIFKTSSKEDLQADDPLTPSQQLRDESRRTRSMVTTRGRARELADSPSVNGDGDSVIIDEGTPVPKRRGRPRKSLPLEDDEVAATPRPTRNSKKLSAQASEEEATPIQSPQVIEEIPNSAEESEDAQIIEADEEVIKTSKANGDVSTLSKITATVTTPVAKKHKRFDSAEPEPEPATEGKSERIEAEEEEDESSDDDAPEEVTTNEAAKSAKEKEREATKAIEEQEAASKKKRQEKAANLKRQAEISSKKRKLDIASGQDEMLPPAQKSKVEVTSSTEKADIDMDEESNTLEGEGTADGRLDSEDDIEEINRTFAIPGQGPLPDLLPAEFLEDDDVDSPEPGRLHSSLPTRSVKPDKLRRLLEKKPKDKRVGSTTFRVAENRNSLLPPKASNQARSLKESWLQGRAGTKIKPNRKPFSQGFIKTKK
ncbi:putative immediate-early protein [Botrytis fragariae]|uniref:Putative immediate-early protein n=1 Tax=Botrytis fragariae TaxID=1964551 RepID=A0A8H6EL79_9HELO|nr:putative immediate-early protein [Botrytis fragariae]KAF5876284.1 putative immediate-early protein [Botrytis fragariae]